MCPLVAVNMHHLAQFTTFFAVPCLTPQRHAAFPVITCVLRVCVTLSDRELVHTAL